MTEKQKTHKKYPATFSREQWEQEYYNLLKNYDKLKEELKKAKYEADYNYKLSCNYFAEMKYEHIPKEKVRTDLEPFREEARQGIKDVTLEHYKGIFRGHIDLIDRIEKQLLGEK